MDFPQAVEAARDAGLVGDVRTAILSASFLERRGQPTWRLLGTGDRAFYLDGTTGAVLQGAYTLTSGGGSTPTHGGQNPIQAIKGLFKKH